MVLQEDPEELWLLELLEALQARKNHGNTATQSQSTDKAEPLWDPKDLTGLAKVQVLGEHLHQVLEAEVQGGQLNQVLVDQLWATLGPDLPE